MIPRLLTALILPVCAATLCTPAADAQTTHIVQGDVFAFRNTVHAANPGDILVVRAGSYYGGVIDKSLRVRCDPGVVFVQDGRSTSLSVFLPAGQLFRMRGGAVGSSGVLFPSLATGGRGTLVFEGLSIGPAARIAGSHVSFHRCNFRSSTSIRPFDEPARIALSECTVAGTMEITSADVTIAGGTITGNDAFLWFSNPALITHRSRLTIAGDATTVIQTGSGVAPTTPAIQTTGGRVVVGPRVQLLSPAPQPIAGTATVLFRDLPAIEAAPAAAGQAFTVTVRAQPGSSTHVLASLPTPVRATPLGDLWIALDGLVLDSGTVPPGGTRATTVNLPTGLPADLPLVLQSITTLTDGRIWVGPPTVVLLD